MSLAQIWISALIILNSQTSLTNVAFLSSSATDLKMQSKSEQDKILLYMYGGTVYGTL